MLRPPPSTSTRQLVSELLAGLLALIAIETRLIRTEMRDASSKAAAGLAMLAIGTAIAAAELFGLVAGAATFLAKAGISSDTAWLIVGAAAVVFGGTLFVIATRMLKVSRLVSRRSLDHFSSLIRSD
jgi:hypothetical protein